MRPTFGVGRDTQILVLQTPCQRPRAHAFGLRSPCDSSCVRQDIWPAGVGGPPLLWAFPPLAPPLLIGASPEALASPTCFLDNAGVLRCPQPSRLDRAAGRRREGMRGDGARPPRGSRLCWPMRRPRSWAGTGTHDPGCRQRWHGRGRGDGADHWTCAARPAAPWAGAPGIMAPHQSSARALEAMGAAEARLVPAEALR